MFDLAERMRLMQDTAIERAKNVETSERNKEGSTEEVAE